MQEKMERRMMKAERGNREYKVGMERIIRKGRDRDEK